MSYITSGKWLLIYGYWYITTDTDILQLIEIIQYSDNLF